MAQYPWLLVDQVAIADAAAPHATLVALTIALAVAGVLVLPSLAWLFRLTNDGRLADRPREDSSEALLRTLRVERGD